MFMLQNITCGHGEKRALLSHAEKIDQAILHDQFDFLTDLAKCPVSPTRQSFASIMSCFTQSESNHIAHIIGVAGAQSPCRYAANQACGCTCCGYCACARHNDEVHKALLYALGTKIKNVHKPRMEHLPVLDLECAMVQ